MRRQVRVIPRALFDARLVDDLRRRGVEIRRHAVRALHRTGSAVLVDDSLRAEVLIGADGAESVVRRLIGVPASRPDRVALAIRGYAPQPLGGEDTQLITMADGHWPAYAWSFPIGDGRANVGYGEVLGHRPLSRADLLANLAPAAADAAVRRRPACGRIGCRCPPVARRSAPAGCCSSAMPSR